LTILPLKKRRGPFCSGTCCANLARPLPHLGATIGLGTGELQNYRRMDKHFPSVNQYLKKIRILHLETANNAHKSIASDRMHQIVFKARHDCSAALSVMLGMVFEGASESNSIAASD
jgi:hypothetical protein